MYIFHFLLTTGIRIVHRSKFRRQLEHCFDGTHCIGGRWGGYMYNHRVIPLPVFIMIKILGSVYETESYDIIFIFFSIIIIMVFRWNKMPLALSVRKPLVLKFQYLYINLYMYLCWKETLLFCSLQHLIRFLFVLLFRNK